MKHYDVLVAGLGTSGTKGKETQKKKENDK